jgi:hypothetical protein
MVTRIVRLIERDPQPPDVAAPRLIFLAHRFRAAVKLCGPSRKEKLGGSVSVKPRIFSGFLPTMPAAPVSSDPSRRAPCLAQSVSLALRCSRMSVAQESPARFARVVNGSTVLPAGLPRGRSLRSFGLPVKPARLMTIRVRA